MQIQGEVLQVLEVTADKKVEPNDERWQNTVGTVV